MLDAPGVQEEAAPGGAPPLGRLADRALGDAGDFGGFCRRPLAAVFGDLFEADGVVGDEVAIDPAVFDHQVQHAREHRRVAAGLDRQEQVARARDRRDARVLHDHLRPLLSRLPDVVGGDGGTLGDV